MEEDSALGDFRRSEVVSHCWISASSVGVYDWEAMAAMILFATEVPAENWRGIDTLRSAGRARRREYSLAGWAEDGTSSF